MQVVCVGANDRRETTFRELMTGSRLFPLVRKQYEHDLGRAPKSFDCPKGEPYTAYAVIWSAGHWHYGLIPQLGHVTAAFTLPTSISGDEQHEQRTVLPRRGRHDLD